MPVKQLFSISFESEEYSEIVNEPLNNNEVAKLNKVMTDLRRVESVRTKKKVLIFSPKVQAIHLRK